MSKIQKNSRANPARIVLLILNSNLLPHHPLDNPPFTVDDGDQVHACCIFAQVQLDCTFTSDDRHVCEQDFLSVDVGDFQRVQAVVDAVAASELDLHRPARRIREGTHAQLGLWCIVGTAGFVGLAVVGMAIAAAVVALRPREGAV